MPPKKGSVTKDANPNYGNRYVRPGKIPPQLYVITPEQVAWVAGIIEGEGSFIVERRRNGQYATRVYASGRITVNMTDLDVIQRLQVLMGGTINHEPQKAENRKDQWRWTFRGYDALILAAQLIRPWMCERRTTQMDRMFSVVDEVRNDVWAHRESAPQ